MHPASSQAPSTTAGEPFNDINADVILRSSDNVDFRVFKCILSLASPVFKDMFTLGSTLQQQEPHSLSIVSMSETGKTLEALLGLLYPGAIVKLAFFEQAKSLIAAVVKYDMSERVTSRLKELIIEKFMCPGHAVSLYSIACQHGWQDLAEKAARATLEIKDLGRASHHYPELDDLSAAAYQRLLEYHYTCGVNLRDLKDYLDGDWFAPPDYLCDLGPFDNFDFEGYYGCTCGENEEDHEWVQLYLDACSKALLYRPHPSTIDQFGFIETLRERGTKLCPRMPLQLLWFRSRYTKKIEEEISDVSITHVLECNTDLINRS